MDPFKITIDDEAAETLGRALKLEGFFPEFKAPHVSTLFPHSALWFYPKDATMIRQGDTDRDVFVICLGSVSITKTFGDAGAEVAVLKAGDLFGEVALVRAAPRTATVIALEDSRIFRLAQEDMGYILKQNNALSQHLISLAEQRR